MTHHDQNLIDLADWRQELPLEWLKGLSEEDRAALEALQHRDVQAGALDGQVPALRINRRWYLRRDDLPVVGQKLLKLARRRIPKLQAGARYSPGIPSRQPRGRRPRPSGNLPTAA